MPKRKTPPDITINKLLLTLSINPKNAWSINLLTQNNTDKKIPKTTGKNKMPINDLKI